MTRKWRESNTVHTGFGQTSCMRDNPADDNIDCEHMSKDKKYKKQHVSISRKRPRQTSEGRFYKCSLSFL